jgi:predicted Zn-dependent peptidase
MEMPANAGIGALAARSAVRGAGDYDAGQLAFAFERLGGALGVSVAADWIGFNTTVLADRTGPAAALLAAVVGAARLEESAVGRERQLMVEEANQVADDMVRFPLQLAFEGAFGRTGYGLPVGGLPETLEAIGGDAVRRY